MSDSYFSRTKVLVIADAGKNFIMKQDSDTVLCLAEAKNLARIAKDVGVDVIKFQIHVFEDEQHIRDKVRHEWIKKNEDLTPIDSFWKPLSEYCKEIGIIFCVTPMSRMAAEKISPFVDIFKIGSADIVNEDLLHYVVAQKKPIIISSGMSTIEEIAGASMLLKTAGADYALLHCTSIYPCPIDKLNLNMIDRLEALVGINGAVIGHSDHSTQLLTPKYAIKHGARIIEKHFTMDKGAYGPDHHMALLPNEMRETVKIIREAELEHFSHGSISKNVYEEEKLLISKFRI